MNNKEEIMDAIEDSVSIILKGTDGNTSTVINTVIEVMNIMKINKKYIDLSIEEIVEISKNVRNRILNILEKPDNFDEVMSYYCSFFKPFLFNEMIK